jgi:hypothetical protein
MRGPQAGARSSPRAETTRIWPPTRIRYRARPVRPRPPRHPDNAEGNPCWSGCPGDFGRGDDPSAASATARARRLWARPGTLAVDQGLRLPTGALAVRPAAIIAHRARRVLLSGRPPPVLSRMPEPFRAGTLWVRTWERIGFVRYYCGRVAEDGRPPPGTGGRFAVKCRFPGDPHPQPRTLFQRSWILRHPIGSLSIHANRRHRVCPAATRRYTTVNVP